MSGAKGLGTSRSVLNNVLHHQYCPAAAMLGGGECFFA